MKMIKRIIIISFVVAVSLMIIGCGSSDSTKDSAISDEAKADSETVDVDLTIGSATVVYSEVYNMFAAPDDYMGKTVKMAGRMSSFHDDNTNKDYYACIIPDALACCSQGFEFELSDGEYPKDGEIITVTGVFDTYKEGEAMYCILRDAQASINTVD